MFLHELKMLQRVRHPNVVKFLGVVLTPKLCIVTEFIEGENLDDALKREMHLEQKMTLIRDLVDGVAYLH